MEPESSEPALPNRAMALDPCGGLLQSPRVKAASAHSSMLADDSKARALEDSEMLVHRGQRKPQRPREVGYRGIAGGQTGDDRAPPGIG
jgi:hypothetical protein